MLINHPNLHRVNTNACIKFDRNPQIHKILSINKILLSTKGHNSVENKQTIVCIIHMDLVYINAYTKFYQNPSIYSKDIEKN